MALRRWLRLRGLRLCFRHGFFTLAFVTAAEAVPWSCFDDESCFPSGFCNVFSLRFVLRSVLPWCSQAPGGCWMETGMLAGEEGAADT